MKQEKAISGFSKLDKARKMRWVADTFFNGDLTVMEEWESFWHHDVDLQRTLDGFSENTLTNYPIPWGVAPNFMINGRMYAIPMVIEESSVVAAAASAAKFWMSRGGFRAEVIDTIKLGQVHFTWNGHAEKLLSLIEELKNTLRHEAAPLTTNMESRGGGILDLELRDLRHLEPNYYQLMVSFETCDSMGANFINSVLESFGRSLEQFIETHPALSDDERDVTIIMTILSNYTPQCLARAWVECPVEQLLGACQRLDAAAFAEKFRMAVRIAHIDPYRAVTHNKGIFNGVDAVALATANDFRAIEASGHAFAARDGQYRSLSYCTVENGTFRFWLELPLALGTVGGLTNLHPLARRSLEMLGNPSATELMMIIAATGLAQNFAAVRSLITTGIQKGHMKMHLMNILNHLGATPEETEKANIFFAEKVISYSAVRDFLENYRQQQGKLAS